ncbi:adenosylcobalamin-dependent ribonucleoside-diphosphate reductase [Candidatus Brachybacter algidus]|uniref:adenosylcobalamin-dependent ribonucleoside-diphosphate reductase n=1 Tax=Candidatus Brachybacter algidus TaxID=2982024 RepID=UPI001D4E0BBA|nr:adenosylcobalamin-dependent ribonucleoside-diphosphate reductase [Candidatus Brachybacter algidus]MBK6447451.1 adenosylcobalamin-dependent ribonucleoside-diphosphate reductase [Candidatus Brachybacter algidus]
MAEITTKHLKTTYSQEEAFNSSLLYFKGDKLAARVWINKYALKDSQGNLYEKTPADMHKRIAGELARIEQKYPNSLTEKQILEVLKDFKYIIPQGSPMTGIGNPFQIASLSNCFVIGNEGDSDSYGGIMKTDQEQVQLMKRRGGVGHDLSHIRPKGSPVKNSALTSTGIVPFMERFSNSTREVAQDGRRGALMLSISIKHPDVSDFIDAKLEQGKITGANISVRMDDEFMNAVQKDGIYVHKYPINSENPVYTKEVRARDLWDKIVHNAWKSAEPGILFWDTIINESLPDCYADLGYKTVSTNPCGEIPLCAYDSCRLLAINLFSYVDKPFTNKATFNWTLFKSHVGIAQRLMDDIIDLELEKIDNILQKIAADPEDDEVKRIEYNLWKSIRHKAKEGRRTGIGITAEGDMLAALGLRYGSEEATELSVEVHKTLAIEAYRGSVSCAKERGAFGIYDAEREKNNPFMLRLKEHDAKLYYEMLEYGRRNIALLTIAPTGTTSLMSQTTSGIEPVFLPVYKRRRKINPNDKEAKVDFVDELGDSWEEYNVFHHKFLQWMEVNGYKDSETYSNEELEDILSKSPYYKATSNDVNYLNKVKMQGAIQKWVDHSISVTINLPSEVTEELVGECYLEAWKSGCKGVTVYRDGSRSGVMVAADNQKDTGQTDEIITASLTRPQTLEADVVRFQNNKDRWIAFIGLNDGKPYEIFTGMADDEDGILIPRWVTNGLIIKNKEADGTSRYDFQYVNTRGYKTTIEGLSYKFNPEYWNYAKLISGTLRHGMPIVSVVDLISSLQLDENINTWKNGVARALKRYIPDGTQAGKSKCSNCSGTNLQYQEGCLTCLDCGNSKCG